jgi:hypothetical protein
MPVAKFRVPVVVPVINEVVPLLEVVAWFGELIDEIAVTVPVNLCADPPA